MKKIVKITIIILIFIALFFLLQRLVTPKYMDSLREGAMISEYYEEETNHDVIFIGDCEVYANISPMVLYEEEGITSYVRGTSQQLIWQSYAILKETLKYETPKVVVFNVNALRYDKPVSEAYNRLTIDKMKWSKEKVEIINSSMLSEENFLSYVFPILRYHSRITELSKEDFEYLFKTKKITHNGFLINQKVKPATTFPTERKLATYEFSANVYDYLDLMRKLCEENNIKFVLMKAPSLYPYWYPEYEENVVKYAEKYHLDYYNFKDVATQIGIDYNEDTYDGGLHLNLKGATKLSKYVAQILKNNYDLPDYRNDNKIKEIYEEKLKDYYKEMEN